MKKFSIHSLAHVENDSIPVEVLERLAQSSQLRGVAMYAWNPTILLAHTPSCHLPDAGSLTSPDQLAISDEFGSLGQIHFDRNGSPPAPVEVKFLHEAAECLRQYGERKRREDLNRFLGGMLHDLRGPWRRMLTLYALGGEDEANRDLLQKTQESEVKAMESLLRMIQTYVETQKSRTESSCDLKSAWERAWYEVSSTNRQVTMPAIHADLQPGINVSMAESELAKMFTLLIDNTCKFCLIDPAVTVSTQKLATGWVQIRYIDHQAKLKDEYTAKLFTPFFRAHGAPYPGHGLGLFLCQQIAQRNCGRIQVANESLPDQGLLFDILLPTEELL